MEKIIETKMRSLKRTLKSFHLRMKSSLNFLKLQINDIHLVDGECYFFLTGRKTNQNIFFHSTIVVGFDQSIANHCQSFTYSAEGQDFKILRQI